LVRVISTSSINRAADERDRALELVETITAG
jgi:hypothetical protein